MRRLVGVLLLAASAALLAGPAAAQDPPPSNEVPTQDIIPKPGSGVEPEDAGDRGGALQLLVLALIVGAIGFGAWRLSREVRTGRSARPSAGPPPD